MSDEFLEYLKRRDAASVKVIDFIHNLRVHGWVVTGGVATAKDFMYSALGNDRDERWVFDYIADNVVSRPIEMPWGICVITKHGTS